MENMETKKIPDSLTVQVDSREQYPLLFPANLKLDPQMARPGRRKIVSVSTEKIKLPTADYRLKEFPHHCLIERKGSAEELAKNIYDYQDSKRQARSFARMASEAAWPYLLLELTPNSLLSMRASDLVPDPEDLLRKLTAVCFKYNFSVIWSTRPRTVPSRRVLGTAMLHLMASAALYGKVPDVMTGSLRG